MAQHLQNFLRSGGTLQTLEKELGVFAKRHPKYNELVQFTYGQLEASHCKAHPVVRDSRGTILDESRNWAVVAMPFRRFYNISEGCADPINFDGSFVEEKVDGSLMIVYWYDGQWQVATKGSPDAGGKVGDFGFTFAELFWKIAKKQGVLSCLKENGQLGRTYLFELTSPYNEVVIPYTEESLTFLASFTLNNNESIVETTGGDRWNFPIVVNRFNFDSIEEMTEFASKLNGLEGEGFVVVHKATGNRVKVKGESYLAFHHMKGSFSPKNVLDALRKGERDEVYKMVERSPIKLAVVEEVDAKYKDLADELEQDYEALRNIAVQKDFALAVKERKVHIPGILFSLRKGQISSVQEGLAKMSLDTLALSMGLKTTKLATDEE